MNAENQRFLEDRLFYLGTEKRLFEDLAKNLLEGKPDFKLHFSNHYDKDKLDAVLHFRKSDTQDMYFLNRYDALLQKPGQESQSRTFHLDNGKGITMKEAYNLLDGRSVHKELKNKEGEKYNAWVKLDPLNKDEQGNAKILQYHKNYGYNLYNEVFKLPVHHLAPEKFNEMTASLEKGNLVLFKLPENEGSRTLLVAANPQFKTLDLYDEKGNPLSRGEKLAVFTMGEDQKISIVEKMNEPSKAVPMTSVHEPGIKMINSLPEKTETVQAKHEVVGSKMTAADPNTKKGIKTPKQEGLLPKKHTSHKKGLSL